MRTNSAARIINNAPHVDTILTLPERTPSVAIAAACREAALAFVNESSRWGKAELAMWLMGPYSEVTQFIDPSSTRHPSSERPVPLLREIDVRMVERVIRSARKEVLETLARLSQAEESATFAFSMLASGFVVRAEDRNGRVGWVPTTAARRLADRVLSLFAVDYLTRPTDYDTDMSYCPVCDTLTFDVIARERGTCHRHGSGVYMPRGRQTTMPYLPEGA